MTKPKYTPNVFIILIFLFLTFAIPVNAQLFTIYQDTLNTTDGFVGDTGRLMSNVTGSFLVADGTTTDPVVNKIIPHFFLDKPLNFTNLNLLGGSYVLLNLTSRGFNNNTGSNSQRVSGIIELLDGGRAITDYNEQAAGPEQVNAACGSTSTDITPMASWSDLFFF